MPGAALVLLSACNGIFADIYDAPADNGVADYGFIVKSKQSEPGIIYIDATDYCRWTYIDFSRGAIDTLDVDDPQPQHWDLAVHRYDTKTNGGAVLETDAVDFNGLTSLPAGDFVPDEWTAGTIVTDVSTMMDGYPGYAESYYNAELSRWLDVDTSTMPPIYTLSGKVYLLRLAGGDIVALRLSDFMDTAGVKGFMTIEYIYPFVL